MSVIRVDLRKYQDGPERCLFSKQPIESRNASIGQFVWPVTTTGRMPFMPAGLSMLADGTDGLNLRITRLGLARFARRYCATIWMNVALPRLKRSPELTRCLI
jgi:hypothetical protein